MDIAADACFPHGMDILHQIVVFDAAELAPESAFWAGVLDGEVETEDDWHMVVVDGRPRVGVQLAPDHVAPDWPGNTVPQQIHMDLYVPEFAPAHERVTVLGARLLLTAQDATPNADFQVYADPAGHPFCLCIPTPPDQTRDA